MHRIASVAVLACGSLYGWVPLAYARGSVVRHDALAGIFSGAIGAAASRTGGRVWQIYVPSATDSGRGVVPVIDTAANAVTRTIAVGNEPASVAITPGGTEAYVVNMFSSDVSVIDLLTNRVMATVDVGCFPVGVAIAPNGRKAYVANDCSSDVSVINTMTNKLVATIGHAGPEPEYVAITPDGAKAYVPGPMTPDVPVIDTATRKVTGHIRLPTYAGDFPGLFFTPDGRFAYVSLNDDSVAVIDTSRGTIVRTVHIGGVPRGPAVTPDQAPVARMTVIPASPGQRTRFDASASTVRYGTIARYAWNFGDGTAATTATPVTTHVYAAPGTYVVELTETSSGGTSTARVFTGETMSRNGGPSAVTTATVVLHRPARATP